MTSPYNYDSDWDYYDSLLTPLQRELSSILSDDPIGYLDDRKLLDDFIDTYFEQLMDYAVDKGFVAEYVEDYLKKQEEP